MKNTSQMLNATFSLLLTIWCGLAAIASSQNTDCNNCHGRRFACVSRTQYAFCANNEVARVTSCPRGHVCSTELYDISNKLCASECVLEFLNYRPTCDYAHTVAPPTVATPNSKALNYLCTTKSQAEGSQYFYMAYEKDNDCKSYIFCQRGNDGLWRGSFFKCHDGYYDQEVRDCVSQKPTSCSFETTIPTTSPITAATPSLSSEETEGSGTGAFGEFFIGIDGSGTQLK